MTSTTFLNAKSTYVLFLTFRMSISSLKIVGLDNYHCCQEVDMLKKDLSSLKKEREDLLIQIRELQTRPDISNDFQVFPLPFALFAKSGFFDGF